MHVTAGTVVAVAAGGALGALARWGVAAWLGQHAHEGQLPWATLTVNVAGSVLLAALVGLALSERAIPGNLNLFLATGFCGALTTFSTFSVEAVVLARSGYWSTAATYVALNLVLCLGASALVLALLWRRPTL